MKSLLIFFLFKCTLFSQTLYLLPDEYNNVIHSLTQEIQKAEKTVFILTDKFNNYELKKSLLKAAKHGVKIKLISAMDDQKKQLALYKNIKTYILEPIESPLLDGKIAITLIIIDDTLTCELSTALDTPQMKHNIDIFTCKENRELSDETQDALSKLIKRAKPYLKN